MSVQELAETSAPVRLQPHLTSVEPSRSPVAMLVFEHITHQFGALAAVRDVSLTINAGEIVCLLGPSGCGKTTLLRVAAGLERPQAGRVILSGKVLTDDGLMVPPEQRGIGLMFQDYALFPHMTILENVAYGLKKLGKAESRNRALEALGRVGMERYADRYPHGVSGGEQQRVALARAIAPSPAVLLMDEPFSGLDQRLRDSVREETVQLLRTTGASAVLVTHDPMEAMRVADRIALLREGRLIQFDRPEAFYRQPADAKVARFFHDFNELEGIVRQGVVATPVGTFPANMADGTRVRIMIRPQGLKLDQQGAEASVIERRFFGDVDLVRLRLEGLPLTLTAKIPAHEAVLEGDKVRIAASPQHVLVFPETE